MQSSKKQKKTLEEQILILQQKAAHSSISIRKILYLLSKKGRSLILILLSLPFCQPVQIPGLSTPFGLAIAFFGLRLAFGKHIWLPKQLLAKKISPRIVKKITSRSLRLVRKMKPWIHPRIDWISRSMPMQIANGLTVSVLGILLSLPLPIPLSNLTAAWAIFFIAIGMLEDDGVFISIGYAIFLTTIVFFSLMISFTKHHLLH